MRRGCAPRIAAPRWPDGKREAIIETRTIPSTGEAIPAIGLGTWSVFDVGRERAAQRAVLERLYAAGATLVDSSPMYGRAEGVAGDLIRDLGARDKSFVATKVWTSGKAKGIAQMENSLRLFHTDTIDLMQVHNLVDWRTHLDTLAGWKKEGRVRYVGITHYVASALGDLARTIEAAPGEIDFVQMAYSVTDRAPERTFLPMCADRGIAVLVNKPLDTGGLIARLARRKLPDWAGEIGLHELAADLPEIRARPSGRDLPDPGDRQPGPHVGQSGGRRGHAAGRRDAPEDRGGGGGLTAVVIPAKLRSGGNRDPSRNIRAATR